MSEFKIKREHKVNISFRTSQVYGMFDVPSDPITKFEIQGDIDLDFDWSVGLVTGPSGSGKTTIAKELFKLTETSEWNPAVSILDNFKKDLSAKDIISTLQGVGLSSPKSYLLPYHLLSNGQQFRADLARVISENDFIVYDEFTSVVDRTVAKAASLSVNKSIRRLRKKFIAVTCHEDVEEWLEPDWKFNTGTGNFARDCLRRPKIKIKITKGKVADWSRFYRHHYLTSSIGKSAQVYLAWVYLGQWVNVGFFSILPAMGMKGWRRGHRTVILPDYQGLGIGNKMIELTAQYLWDTQKIRFRATTSAPQIVNYRKKRPERWRLVDGVKNRAKSKSGIKTSAGRLTTSWEYLPS